MSESTFEPRWRKSSACSGAACVEVAKVDGHYLIRDSKNPGPSLRFTEAEWTAFEQWIKSN
jgi:hypothetical protein